jgi:tetratricopeptide (TPR) repeat protein
MIKMSQVCPVVDCPSIVLSILISVCIVGYEVELESETLTEVKQMERRGVIKAEEGHLEEALQLFTQAIDAMPNRASGYNNRAQALRLSGKNDEALEDLDRAVQLSNGKGKAGVNALCQRALLLLLKGKDEEANCDLQAAAKEGHDFAKSMLVRMNPYSALCNQMLIQMMQKLRGLED